MTGTQSEHILGTAPCKPPTTETRTLGSEKSCPGPQAEGLPSWIQKWDFSKVPSFNPSAPGVKLLTNRCQEALRQALTMTGLQAFDFPFNHNLLIFLPFIMENIKHLQKWRK